MNFIGFGMIQNALGLTAGGDIGSGLENAAWIYILGTFLFYLVAGLIYYRKSTKPYQARSPLQWWPADTPNALAATACVLSFSGMVFTLLPAFPGVQIFYVAKGPLAIAGFFLAIFAFFRTRSSPVIWFAVCLTFVIGLVTVLSQGGGRRELLGILACPPVAIYWQVLRHRSKTKNVFWLGTVGMAGLLIISAYATIRHADRDSGLGHTGTAVARIKRLPSAITERATNLSVFGEQGSLIDAQNGVWAGMQVITFTTIDQAIDYDWLHCFKFIVVNPIPRSLWPDKPIGLGKILPVMMGEPRVTWGPTITGHCFYDGGWVAVVIYGLLIGGGCRYLDRRIALDPDNPWQIAMFVSVIGHIIGLSRGDCGTFIVNILWGIFFVAGFAKIMLVALPRREHQPRYELPHRPPLRNY